MTHDATRLLEAALRLDDTERAELACRLIDSLDRRVDDDADSAWRDEVHRRAREMDEGKVTPLDWPDARRLIRGLDDDASQD